MKAIRGGMGLGDALYVQAVARHLVARGERVKVLTAWPEVFAPLNGSVETAPFTRAGNPIVAHYTTKKGRGGTTQFEDVCENAGFRNTLDLKIDWPVRQNALVDRVRYEAGALPIVLVELMRPPMGRSDGFGASLLPRGEVMQQIVDRVGGRAYTVLVGTGRKLYDIKDVDLDLSGKTSVSDLFDLAMVVDGLIGYPSYFVPLAESFGKRALLLWSRAGLQDSKLYVRQITPEKIIHRKDLLSWVVDDAPLKQIEEVADAFLR